MTELQEEVERILEKHLSENFDLMVRKAIEWGVKMETRKEIRNQLGRVIEKIEFSNPAEESLPEFLKLYKEGG